MDWLQWLTASGAVGAMGLALATYLKTRPAMKIAELQGEQALWAEIATMRAELTTERKSCDERIERMEQRHAEDNAKLDRELRVLRHDRNNVRQALNAMFVMLKREGADVPEIVAAVEEMLKRGDEVIAIEKGAMR